MLFLKVGVGQLFTIAGTDLTDTCLDVDCVLELTHQAFIKLCLVLLLLLQAFLQLALILQAFPAESQADRNFILHLEALPTFALDKVIFFGYIFQGIERSLITLDTKAGFFIHISLILALNAGAFDHLLIDI